MTGPVKNKFDLFQTKTQQYMKKTFLIISAGMLFFTACDNNKKTGDAPAADNSVAEKNLAAVHGINKAVETGDVSKLGDYIAADAVDHNMVGMIKGFDSITAVHTQADDMKAEILKEFADSTHVIQWMHYSGKSKMAMGSVPAGAPYDMTMIHVASLSNGKVTEHWEYMLPSDMMKMMAPSPPPMKKEEVK
jgi:ketosteroid isomerase-like protein